MKGKYITTNIVLACLASAAAARKSGGRKKDSTIVGSQKEAANVAAFSLPSQAAA